MTDTEGDDRRSFATSGEYARRLEDIGRAFAEGRISEEERNRQVAASNRRAFMPRVNARLPPLFGLLFGKERDG